MNAPPRYVPTLTDVVRPGQPAAETPRPDAALASPALLEEQLVQRVMQRVDMVLERRLREAVGQLILTQTQALGPRLREEIEGLVRESVKQAMPPEPGSRRD
jgi:hypothetical protein